MKDVSVVCHYCPSQWLCPYKQGGVIENVNLETDY